MDNFIDKIIAEYANFSQVEAIAIGGSSEAGTSDNSSDIDIYIFINEEISIEQREKLVKKFSSKYEVGGEYFGAGDEYFVDKINKQLDVMFWNVNWFNSVVENIWIKHYPQNGYTTAFLYTLNNFKVIYDKDNWLKNLQLCIKTEYPEELRQNIIKRNMMLLKDKPFASYYEQIEKALKRKDIVSINHRISAFLASYFDIIFAINKLLHPGEKRLIRYALDNCRCLPQNFEPNIEKLIHKSDGEVLTILDNMVEELRKIIPTQ